MAASSDFPPIFCVQWCRVMVYMARSNWFLMKTINLCHSAVPVIGHNPHSCGFHCWETCVKLSAYQDLVNFFFLSNKEHIHGPICNVDAPREQDGSSQASDYQR